MNKQPYIDFAKDKLGVVFENLDILITAFTHRSYLNEHRKSVKSHNERLEFLGDAVLELVVTEYLYGNYSEPEGILTNWRSALVRTESISLAAHILGLESMLRLSRGEKMGTERARAQILANTYEAVIGAIYLDQGYEASKRFIADSLLVTFDSILESGSWVDPKSQFQEWAQSKHNTTPSYKVINEVGPDHDKEFTVGVYIGKKLMGKGSGPSKQIGQQKAAELALKNSKK